VIRLFLDANILLDFYRFGADDLAEVKKLITMVQQEELTIYTNQLLSDEVKRMREGAIAGSFSEFKAGKFKARVPNYCSGMDGLTELQEALKQANKAHSALVSKLEAQITARTLDADTLISDLFAQSQTIELDADLQQRAEQRQAWNNPPRKAKDTVGDALHWEALLSLENMYNFHLVSRDGDFGSELKPNEIKDFLKDEWTAHGGDYAKISLHTSLANFFRSQFPQIKLSDEAQKNALIERLQASPNFSSTHDVVEELSAFDFFTTRQVKSLFEALVENNQVGWIATDSDVNEFYLRLKNKAYLLPIDMWDEISRLLEVDEDDFFIPF
jgi:predicted nucleic acid-binding protein